MWIEITLLPSSLNVYVVAPLAGVWIEIIRKCNDMLVYRSLPLRECGLKSIYQSSYIPQQQVAPLAGVWIEI